MSRSTRLLFGAGLVIAVAVTAAIAVTGAGGQATAAAQRSPVRTAMVMSRALSATVSEDGTLTYAAQADGSPYTIINQARGTYTQLPAVGQVVAQGRVLYRVNGTPVVLLRGATPAYRTLAPGISGADVAELNADLVALGYAQGTGLSPTSDAFGSATAAALAKLQAAVGAPASGSLPLGQAVFAPTRALRVIALSAPLGGSGQPGQTLMQGTATARQVQVALDAAQQTDVAVGDSVSITLPDNRTTGGRISSVGTVASCPPSAGAGGSGSSSTEVGTDACSAAAATPTITVEVTPSEPAATGTWDQAPVQVGITTARVRRALVVPVDALLARANGSYAVEVLDSDGARRLVQVALGLFDDPDGLVQVSGARLAAGQRVVVPST